MDKINENMRVTYLYRPFYVFFSGQKSRKHACYLPFRLSTVFFVGYFPVGCTRLSVYPFVLPCWLHALYDYAHSFYLLVSRLIISVVPSDAVAS